MEERLKLIRGIIKQHKRLGQLIEEFSDFLSSGEDRKALKAESTREDVIRALQPIVAMTKSNKVAASILKKYGAKDVSSLDVSDRPAVIEEAQKWLEMQGTRDEVDEQA